MIRKISVVFLLIAVGFAFASNASSSADNWKNPKRVLERKLLGPTLESADRVVPQQTYNVVATDVLNLRVLLGGGRKLIRHDCPDYPDALEAVYTLDTPAGYNDMVIHSAISSDQGVTWSPVGPLSWNVAEFRDRSHCIAYQNDLTHIGYQEAGSNPGNGGSMVFFTSDIFGCLQAFNPFTQVTDAPAADSLDEYFLQQSMSGSNVYWSFADFNHGSPYNTYFRSSTDAGATWSDYLNVTATIGTDGFDMAGMDGALSMDSDGNFIAALAMVGLDAAWADANGFLSTVSYPAYTQSTDGGATWSDLKLVWGNDGSQYPRGHTGDPVFDAMLHYIGGVQDLAFTAFNNVQDNVAITSDGLVHLTYTMNDTTVGYAGVFHTLVDNGTMNHDFIGFTEDPNLSGISGVAFMPSISEGDDGHVVVGWTEFDQGAAGAGDICFALIPAGDYIAEDPVNVTNTTGADETYQRIVDRTVPTGNPDEWYIDWLFLYYASDGNAADTTLWHLQATYNYQVGIEDDDTKGPGIPKVASLGQNYPNPFNPTTAITYALAEKGRVVLEVMNLRGQRVATLVDGVKEAGLHSITWDGKNNLGHTVSSGIYFYRLRTDSGFSETKKMVALK